MLNKFHHIEATSGLSKLDKQSVHLIVTSPPYAGIRQKSYETKTTKNYNSWFIPIAKKMLDVLHDNGSLILNLGDKFEKGQQSPYIFELVLKLREIGFKHISTNMWVKKKGVPQVSARRATNSFEYIFHFCKGIKPTWNIDEIRAPYSPASLKRAKYLIKDNVSNREGREQLNVKKYKKWVLHPKGAFPKNVLYFSQDIGKNHPAAFSDELPTYFIKVHSNKGDVVLDPFAGRGTSLISAKNLGRQFVGFELKKEYVELGKKLYGLNVKL